VSGADGLTDDTAPDRLRPARRTVALACRVLALAGLAEDVLGHVSARWGVDRMLLRCRGPQDRGLLFTVEADVRLVDLDGDGDLYGGYALPNEFPMHSELLRARPDVGAVVHAHPPAVLLAGLAGLRFEPVFGAYNIPAWRLAAAGVPVYPRSVLVRSPALGREVVRAMGDAAVCVLKGHGATTCGPSVEAAVAAALNLESLARVTVALAASQAHPGAVPPDDVAELPDLGPAFNDGALWRHHLARLEQAGLADT
jgi:ribulose-5-phosphate 4-epimerase/fuculose-1-phosphate aldolase